MDYFISGLYGDYEAYKRIKKSLNEFDRLWILGDVLDGNSNNPEDCIRILDDIFRQKNMYMVLGDHEYYHAMRLISMEDRDTADIWTDALLSEDITGEPLMQLLDQMDEDEIDDFTMKLTRLEASEMTKIGSNFFYVCHGSPSVRQLGTRNADASWQYKIVTGYPNFDSEYIPEITSDLRIEEFIKNIGYFKVPEICLITGHIPILDLKEEGIRTLSGENTDSIVAFQNRKFCINQNITADDNTDKRILLGIDAAGFILKEI